MELHDRFSEWLVAGARTALARDVAVHASACPDCLRAASAFDALVLVDAGLAPEPFRLTSSARPRRGTLVRRAVVMVGAVGAAATIVAAAYALSLPRFGPGVAARGSIGAETATASPNEGILGGVSSPTLDATPDASASSTETERPTESPDQSPTVLSVPSPRPPGSTSPIRTPGPSATATATSTPLPSVATAAPTASPTPTPSPTPTATPTPPPTATPTPTPTPTPDSDGDGVPDDIDECPLVPAGPFPDPLHPGCPLP